jgi:hypothetical protein
VSQSDAPGRTSEGDHGTWNVSMNSQSLSYLRYPETPVSLHSPQGETDVQNPRGYEVSGMVGGRVSLAVDTA